MNKADKNLLFKLTNKRLVEGIFLHRLNRFVVECQINDKKQLAHLPNPGRLWELLFKGSQLLLYKNDSNDRSIKYTVTAVFKDSHPVLLHTIKTNSVAEWLIKNHLIEELKDYEFVSREKQVNNSRIDFFLQNGEIKLYLEVKSCTLFQNQIAMFPDAVTLRGSKHLVELAELKSENTQSAVLFLIHSGMIKYFLPEYHTDLNFAMHFLTLRKKLKYLAYSLSWNSDLTITPERVHKVKIPFEVLEKEANDAGTYILIIHNPVNQKISVGELGRIEFQKGYYCYVGSALQNLSKRINRHKRTNKKLHWHIDYLLTKTRIIKSIEIRSPERLECEVAKSLGLISESFVKDFGSSDCNCNSHLFYFKHNPIQRKDFIELILHFRMKRLIDKYKL